MSVYPMEIAKVSLGHKGGTKDYFLTLIVNATGQAVVIRRWGKKGATGQVTVKKFDNGGLAETDFQKELTKRQSGSKGYQIEDSKTLTVESQSQLPLMVGRTVFPQMGGSNVKHIDPGYDVTGMREPESNRDDDDNFVGNTPRHVSVDPAVVEKLEQEKRERELDSMRSNPKFGRF